MCRVACSPCQTAEKSSYSSSTQLNVARDHPDYYPIPPPSLPRPSTHIPVRISHSVFGVRHSQKKALRQRGPKHTKFICIKHAAALSVYYPFFYHTHTHTHNQTTCLDMYTRHDRCETYLGRRLSFRVQTANFAVSMVMKRSKGGKYRIQARTVQLELHIRDEGRVKRWRGRRQRPRYDYTIYKVYYFSQCARGIERPLDYKTYTHTHSRNAPWFTTNIKMIYQWH